MSKNWFNKLKKEVFPIMKNNVGAHDFYHTIRVCNLSILIGKKEKADLDVLKASSLLHDIYADRNYQMHASMTVKKTKKILNIVDFPKEKIKQVIESIENHEKYDWTKVKRNISKEAKILQDADRLDAIGAIGIARCFYIGGKYGRHIWNPKDKPGVYRVTISTEKSSINHFYEKLLKLKDTMNTKTGKKLAQERHKFMVAYLKQFFREWNLK